MTGRWVCLVEHDRMCPVMISCFWMLTRNDRTMGSCVQSLQSNASGHNLNVQMTVEIGRSAVEAGDTWRASYDRTLRSSVRSI